MICCCKMLCLVEGCDVCRDRLIVVGMQMWRIGRAKLLLIRTYEKEESGCVMPFGKRYERMLWIARYCSLFPVCRSSRISRRCGRWV